MQTQVKRIVYPRGESYYLDWLPTIAGPTTFWPAIGQQVDCSIPNDRLVLYASRER